MQNSERSVTQVGSKLRQDYFTGSSLCVVISSSRSWRYACRNDQTV